MLFVGYSWWVTNVDQLSLRAGFAILLPGAGLVIYSYKNRGKYRKKTLYKKYSELGKKIYFIGLGLWLALAILALSLEIFLVISGHRSLTITSMFQSATQSQRVRFLAFISWFLLGVNIVGRQKR